MQKVLQSYLRRLSNLSGNNRSLLLLRLISDQFIDIHDLDFAEGSPSFEIIKGLMERKKQIPLCSEVDSRTKSSNELSRRLKKIQRIEQFIFQERGAKDLYVGWPFIRGKFSDDTLVRCPLLFFPVSIEKKKNTWFLSKREGVNVTLNKTFLLAYSYYNDIKLDEELIETVIDDYDKDDRVFRTQLYELLKNSDIEINFNQENFSDQLKSFNNYRKNQFESSEKTGVLKMHPEAVLGIFPQSGSYLVPDYLKLIESSFFKDLEEFFVKRTEQDPEQMSFFSRISEENTFTPFPLDAYQEKAIKEVKKGNSILVQGPPGTGKSQLISNLICDFVARGKNVLLVCQKRAALDVVYDRLKQKDIHDFVALVHDFKNDRKSIFEQINNQIESVETYEKKNNSLDSIQLERNFVQASRRIDQLSEELQEFKEALFDESECGKSVKELYLVSNPDAFHFPMNLEYKAFHFDTLQETLRRFKDYLVYYDKFEKRMHFWAKGPSFAGFKTADLIRLLEVVREIPTFNESIQTNSSAFSARPVDFETAEYFSTKIPEIEELLSSLDERVIFKVFKQLHEDRPTKELNWLIQLERTMMACFKGVGLETSLKSSELGHFQEILQANLNSKNNPLNWLKWTFSKEKAALRIVLADNQLRNNKKGFNTLVARIDNRLNFEHIATSIKENSWLHNFPQDLRKIDVQDWFYWQKMGLNAYYVCADIRSIHEYIPISKTDQDRYLKGLKKLKKVVAEVPNQIAIWSRYINIHQVRTIILKKEDPEKLEDLLRKDYDAICEYHGLKNSLSSEEQRVLDKINEHKPRTLLQALDLFKNSLCLAWIDHIESKYPDLRTVSSGKLDRQVGELIDAMEVKRSTSKEILLMKARESTYQDLVYNRLKNRVTYRDLQHQVTKKRRIWPIRRVLNEFIEEVFTLLPCWMCSPESASAIFPMQEYFDLVIFDEASQCFAERGIPAMYRGKQLVIAGDSQQLQPNDLYRVRWDEEEDDTLELSIDSLLDLTRNYLPEVKLAGHYRSKSLELIDFSNQEFYDGKLRLLPDYHNVNKKEPSIKYQKVEGVWEDGYNLKEAKEVVRLILTLITKNEEKEIGVVTFNFRQQGVILDVLEEVAEKKNLLIPESLFVKNIENVQGDECDIIIFSTGYAPDKKGQVKLQFGSLNVEGGENRLNVAVTRAREFIYVVSSLHPSQLHTDDTKNDGPKLLKKYLEYAWRVSNKMWSPHIPSYDTHAIDWFLRKKLENPTFHEFQDFTLAKELPFADISVKKDEKYTGLILTDDERYFEALSPKQIYAFQYFHLKMKNWPHIRFHSREIWIDQETTKEKMKRFLYSNNK